MLEVGTGSGYAAAILAKVAAEVFTVERHESLAESARERLKELGFENVKVLHGDGTLGWPEHAPYDAIAVAAAGPSAPEALIAQLASGGRLVMPVGTADAQRLIRITRDAEGRVHEEELAAVRFVPLIGEQGWKENAPAAVPPPTEPVAAAAPIAEPAPIAAPRGRSADGALPLLVRETCEPLSSMEDAAIGALVERVGSARLVLLGEASHGTSEFYRMRARISMELIERCGFDFVAIEGDWPDAARIDAYVLGDAPRSQLRFTPFHRFPTWMWRNREVDEFVRWLRERNLARHDREERTGFHGLDLYSLFTSIAAVLEYLDKVDPLAARAARARYGTLTPWQKDPAAYGKAVLVGRYASSEEAVVRMLREMLERRLDYSRLDGERFFDAVQNARVVANAERYYRSMYYGSAASWNLRDSHMFDTLQSLLSFYGPGSRGIVWEHNSHLGDARATEMSERGELNVGQLCREKFGAEAYLVGFGTHTGTVAAASGWDEPMEVKDVRPSHPDSYEHLFHAAAVPVSLTHLRDPRRPELRDELLPARLERAIGVIYRPETERASHYFYASLPQQFDEYVWFDETRAVTPLGRLRPSGDETQVHPFEL